MEKQTYYIGVSSGQITQQPETTQWEFKVEATDEEITQLRQLFNRAAQEAMGWAYIVAHPISGSKQNLDYRDHNETLQEIYEMIYKLGDEPTREHIREHDIIEAIGKDNV